MKITSLQAQEILDSRSHPTVKVEIELEDGTKTAASVPSGTSTGATEAFELRDNDPNRFNGKGVLKAVDNVNTTIAGVIVGQDAYDQQKVDDILINTDGTPSKAKLGANAITGVSMAICRAAALSQHMELYQYFGQLSGNELYMMPQPQIVVMEGGRHGHWSIDIQEIMVMPFQSAFASLTDMLQATSLVSQAIYHILRAKGYDTGIGHAGVYAPSAMQTNEEALEIVATAISKAGYEIGQQFAMAIDVAASEFYLNGVYTLRSEANRTLTEEAWMAQLLKWVDQFKLWSVEDGLDQESWQGWAELVAKAGTRCQIVGDDLVTTNPNRISLALQQRAINSVTIKINQIGTISETLKAVKMSNEAGLRCIISHRGGETTDDMVADLVIGTTAAECKFGSPDHDERLLKYHRLHAIERQLAAHS